MSDDWLAGILRVTGSGSASAVAGDSSGSSSSWTEESGADGIVGRNLTLSLGDDGSRDSSWKAD